MTPTIGFNLRLPLDVSAALDRMAPAREKTTFVIALIRREAEKRGELPPTKPVTAKIRSQHGSKTARRAR